MAVEAVRELVDRYQEIQKELRNLSKELENLKKNHKTFWEKLQQECYKTCHDLTPEQLRWWYNYKNSKNSVPITRLTAWQFKLALKGYECPYCKGHVGHQIRSWNPPAWDGYSKKSFDPYLRQDTINWPPKKKALFEKAKKELDDYFAKVEPLEQHIVSQKKERLEILNELSQIYSLSDSILGHSSSYERQIRQISRELNPRKSRDDYYYPD